MKKQRFLHNRSGKNYDAQHDKTFEIVDQKNPEKTTKIQVWGLYQRVLFLFWRRVESGSLVDMVNKAKRLNGMTGSANNTSDFNLIATRSE